MGHPPVSREAARHRYSRPYNSVPNAHQTPRECVPFLIQPARARVTIFSNLPAYLQERKHLQTLPLSVLSDSRLGIDAAYYLQSLYDSPSSREPLLAATGGLPLALTTRIESDLRTLEKLRIKPVFVFPGLTPNKRSRHMQRDVEQQEACRDRNLAWSKYESGQEEAATKLFEGRSGLTHWDLWRPVLRIFRNRNVEFLVAPYVAWAQVR